MRHNLLSGPQIPFAHFYFASRAGQTVIHSRSKPFQLGWGEATKKNNAHAGEWIFLQIFAHHPEIKAVFGLQVNHLFHSFLFLACLFIKLFLFRMCLIKNWWIIQSFKSMQKCFRMCQKWLLKVQMHQVRRILMIKNLCALQSSCFFLKFIHYGYV